MNRILVPQRQLIVPHPQSDKPTSRLKGFYQMRVLRSDGSERLRTPWFENEILDSGLDLYLQDTFSWTYCQVGTSGTAVDVATQSTLQGYLVGTNTTVGSDTYGAYTSAAPYYIYGTMTKEFGIGVATGTLAEVGWGKQTATGGLLSRALIKDGGGSPTTITILASELLQVTYQLRLYPDNAGGSGSVTISGTTYDYTWLPADMDRGNIVPYSAFALNSDRGYSFIVNAGSMGTILTAPTGTSASTWTSVTKQAYVGSSLQRDTVVSAAVGHGNVGGIKSCMLSTSRGEFQFEFATALPKDNTKTLSLTIRIAAARY